MTVDYGKLEKEVDELWERSRTVDVELAELKTSLGSMDKQLNSINSSLGKIMWIIIAAVAASLLRMVIP